MSAAHVRASAVYVGRVYHRRALPRVHAFGLTTYFLYIDLDELGELFRGRWLWSARRPAVGWLRRKDLIGPIELDLREAVLGRVERELGFRPAGAVRVLTRPRTLGACFNPVSFYYCFGTDERLEAIVAEIQNTPWNERFGYVLDARDGLDPGFEFEKRFHVSPFLDMGLRYLWRFGVPGESLRIHMQDREPDGEQRLLFEAGFRGERRPWSGPSLAGVLARFPLHSIRVLVSIYLHAGLLFLRRTPFFVHPGKRSVRSAP